MITLDPKHTNYTLINPFKATYETFKPEDGKSAINEANKPRQHAGWQPYEDNKGTVLGKFPPSLIILLTNFTFFCLILSF